MADFWDLVNICKEKEMVYIQTHNFPDPDAIGSAYGLQFLFEEYGIRSKICFEGRIDKLSTQKMLDKFNIKMYAYNDIRSELKDDDYIVCVDSQKNSGNITDFIGDEIACIDHHPTFVDIEYKYKQVEITGSCSTLIAEHIAASGFKPTKDVASALIYGLKMDTLSFSRGVTQRDIKMFSFLFDYRDEKILSDLEHNNMVFNDLRAYGAAIDNIKIYGPVGFSKIPYACPDAMIAILSDFILSLVEVEVAVIYSERDDGLKFSIRSERDDVHAGQLTNQALKGIGDGGGHASMAGGLIPKNNIKLLGNYPDFFIRDTFMNIINQALNK